MADEIHPGMDGVECGCTKATINLVVAQALLAELRSLGNTAGTAGNYGGGIRTVFVPLDGFRCSRGAFTALVAGIVTRGGRGAVRVTFAAG
ncbi:MAG: hypothetical protein M3355_04730 [Actinomycetota bacterium]|nr:hypothetical protein [Actinomycetota bacterium]